VARKLIELWLATTGNLSPARRSLCERWRRGSWPHLTSHVSRSLG